MKKRILSMALAFCMTLTLMPIVAKAVTNLDVSTGNVVIGAGGDYIITGATTTNTIKVDPNVTGVNIILSNVTIDVSATDYACAFDIGDGASVDVTLLDGTTNTFKSGLTKAGIKVEAPTSGTAGSVIMGGTGTLIVVGGKAGSSYGNSCAGAGIGSNGRKDPNEQEVVVPASGNITINSGTIQATGGEGIYYAGAGIGGGACHTNGRYACNGGNTIIHGGNVKATGGSVPDAFSGAGIGGGAGVYSGMAGTVLIDGGVVDAKSGNGQWVGNSIGSGYANAFPRLATASINIQGTAVVNAVTPDAIYAYAPIDHFDNITIGGTAVVKAITGLVASYFKGRGAIFGKVVNITGTPKITVLSSNKLGIFQEGKAVVPISGDVITSTIPIISGVFEGPLSTTSSTDINITGGNSLNTQTISLPAKYASFATTVGSQGNYYGTIGTNSLQEISSSKYNFKLINSVNNYNVKSMPLSSIAVKTPANKLVYEVGGTLDITGLVIEGTYSDESKRNEIITTENITGFDSSVLGDKTLTVNVGAKTTTYDVQIKANQSELSIIDIPATVTYGDNPFTLVATGGTGAGAITYSSDNTNVLSVDNNGKVTVVGAGDAIITATKAAEGNYNSISTTKKITVNKADQSVIEITDVPSKVTYGDSKFTLKTTGGLGTGVITYSSDNASALTVNENTGEVTVVGAGKATITATKAAEGNYNSISITTEITVDKADQSEFSISNAPSTVIYGDNPFPLSITGGSGTGVITYSSDNASALTVDENTGEVTVVGTGKATITATKSTDSNYNSANATTEITVNKKDITIINADVKDKIYDGTTISEFSGTPVLSGVINGDIVTLTNGTPSFANKNVGSDIEVNFTNFSIDGTDKGNYNLKQPSSVQANITSKEITVKNTAVNNKTYDGSTIAKFSEAPVLDGVISGETVILTTGTPSFVNKNVGSDMEVNFTNFSIDGTDVGNYNLIQPTAGTANITTKDITVITAVKDKAYDGTIFAEFLGTPALSGVIIGDTVTLTNGTPSFNSKNVGISIGIGFTIFSIDGVDAANYSLIQPNSIFAKINKANQSTLEISNVPSTVTYGDDSFTLSTTGGSGTGDTIYSSDNTNALTVDENTGEVTVVGAGKATITATKAGDSNYNSISTTTEITVNKKDITIINADVKDKIYDGTTTAEFSGTPQLSGLKSGDVLTLTNGTPSFTSKNVGSDIEVNFTTFSIDGTDVGNYNLIQPSSVQANITSKDITIKNTAVENKTYDGSTSAKFSEIPVLDGVINEDKVTLISGTPSFANKNVGSDIEVNFTTFSIDGTDVGNYNLIQPSSVQANITSKDITIKNTAVENKTYDGSTSAKFSEIPVLDGVINEDKVTLISGTPSFANKNVGNDIGVNFTTFSIDGTDKGNYNLIQPSSGTANINKATLTVSTSNVSIISGDSLPQFNVTISGFVNGEKEVDLKGFKKPEVMQVAQDTTKVGVYPLTFSNGNPTNNYSFSPLSGSSLTIIEKINAEKPKFDKAAEAVTYVKDATASALNGSATVTDGGTVSYQWYESDGTPISKATDKTYTPSTEKTGIFYYYIVATNTNNSVNGDKIATATSNTYKVVVNKVEILPADKKDDTPTVTIKDDNVLDKALTESDKDSLTNGSNISIKLNVAMVEAPVNKGDESSVTSELKGQNFGIYLDISLIKTIIDAKGKVTNDKISETNGVIRLVIDIPENLRNANRTFSIIRVHNGVAETLVDLDNDPNTITIETDKFSTYALAYKDEVTNTSAIIPTKNDTTTTTTTATKTGDNTPVIPLTIFAIVSLFVGVNIFRKGRYKEAIKK